tara:strand:- start:7411 stop:7827 length:417 start_codon:yes stop_codon:yes gene_type:complete
MKNKNLISLLIILLLILSGSAIYFAISLTESPNSTTVVKVIDGDTFILASGETVRLICVNTPEAGEPGYLEAQKYLKDLIFGKSLNLEADTTNRDRYGRLLRYAYLDDLFINKELVSSQHARVYPVPPNTALCNEIEK